MDALTKNLVSYVALIWAIIILVFIFVQAVFPKSKSVISDHMDLTTTINYCADQAMGYTISSGLKSNFNTADFQNCITENGFKITVFPPPVKSK